MKSVSRGRVRKASRVLSILLVLFAMFLSLAPVSLAEEVPEYVPEEAGHPLRIIAYLTFPVGVILDYCVMRPVYWVGKYEPLATLFGFEAINGNSMAFHEDEQE